MSAASARLFLYRQVLGLDLPWLDDLAGAIRPARLPVVLARDEVGGIIAHLHGMLRLIASLPAARAQVSRGRPRMVVAWAFPATRAHRQPETGHLRRHHSHESALQRAFHAAVFASGIPKRRPVTRFAIP